MKKLIFWLTLWALCMGVLATKSAHAASTGSCYDSADNSVMMHFDGSDGSTTFTDESGSTYTVNGNAQIDTAQSVFGGSSGLFDGTGDYLNVASATKFDFGSGDFTVDFRYRSNTTVAEGSIMGSYTTSGYIFLIFSNPSTGYAHVYNDTPTQYILSPHLNGSQWYHIALVKSGTKIYLYVDGTIVNSGGTTVAGTFNTNGHDFQIARSGSGATLNGWLDEFRVTKGVAIWSTNFTPPSSAYTDCNASTFAVKTVWFE